MVAGGGYVAMRRGAVNCCGALVAAALFAATLCQLVNLHNIDHVTATDPWLKSTSAYIRAGGIDSGDTNPAAPHIAPATARTAATRSTTTAARPSGNASRSDAGPTGSSSSSRTAVAATSSHHGSLPSIVTSPSPSPINTSITHHSTRTSSANAGAHRNSSKAGSLPAAGGTTGHHSESAVATAKAHKSAVQWVSSAEILRLTSTYSQALAALSAALHEAQHKTQEVAALRVKLDELRRLQRQQLYPQLDTQQHLRQEPLQQQRQQQLQEPLQQQRQQQLQVALSSSNHQQPHGPQQQQPQPQQEATRQRANTSSHNQLETWQHTVATGTTTASSSSKAGAPRTQGIRMFIGVYTGVNSGRVEPHLNYTLRRNMLRSTWFPGTRQERLRWEVEHGLVLRFVAGAVTDPLQEAVLRAEERQYGDILRLPLQEGYSSLPNKTRTFFKAVTDTWPHVDWVLKLDDDVYLNPSRLLAASQQWDRMGAQYVGCMKHGFPWKQHGTKWYEPAHLLMGSTYHLHAYGSIYAISGPVARSVIGANWRQLRLLANEDTSVGLWMLAANVTFFEDMRLCSPICTAASVGVLRNRCAGLCSPLEELPALHSSSNCSGPPGQPLWYHSGYPEHKVFEKMWVA